MTEPTLLTPDTIDPSRYYTPDDLRAMPDEALAELVAHIPAGDRRFYEQAFDRGLRDTYGSQPITDEQRYTLLGVWWDALVDDHHLPTGVGWVQAGERVVHAVSAGEELAPIFEEAARSGPSRRMTVVIALAAVIFLCGVIWILTGISRRRTQAEEVASATATALSLSSLEATPTLTPTPFALEDTDRIIDEGQYADYYPTTIELFTDTESSRVFVVQQIEVAISDWEYDANNPDTASWVSGLIVRPPIGIPYSSDNAQLLESLEPGDEMLLRMSTGNVLTFEVSRSERVPRQDTSIFRQVSPGIVLILLGEPDVNDRLVVYGSYPAEQELSRFLPEGLGTAAFQPMDMPVDFGDFSLTVEEAYISSGLSSAPLPTDMMFLLVDVRIEAGDEPVDVNSLQAYLTDSSGITYSPARTGGRNCPNRTGW